MSLDLTDLILLQVTPVAIRTIGWRFYLVFICVSAAALVWTVFQVPETKGLPLEKIAELFGDETEHTSSPQSSVNQSEKQGYTQHVERIEAKHNGFTGDVGV